MAQSEISAQIAKLLANYPVFTNIPTMPSKNGGYVRFLLTDLDEEYVVPPIGYATVEPGMLAPEDYVVGEYLEKYLQAEYALKKCSFWEALFKTKKYSLALSAYNASFEALKQCAAYSPQMRAAGKRVAKVLKQVFSAKF